MVYSRYFTKILVRYLTGIWKLHTAGYTRVKQTTQLTEALKDKAGPPFEPGGGINTMRVVGDVFPRRILQP
jgi:hypothetical protein